MDRESFARCFSQPIGPGGLYPPPPYVYRGVEDVFVAYEADAAGVEALLPPGVHPADDPPVCIAWARWVPLSTFGPYHEAYVMVRARFGEQVYLYQPFIFTDGEVPLAAGREIWGYAKKLATMGRTSGGGATPFGEQLLFTVERPRGKRVMTVSIACDRLEDPAVLENLPVLSTRLIPNAEAGRPPSVAQLVRLDVEASLHVSADGTPMLWAGRGSVTMDSPSEVDPWYLLAPRRLLGGWLAVLDFDLPHGTVVHDYLDEPGLWEPAG